MSSYPSRRALFRGEASLAQVRKVLRAVDDLQKAQLARELLAGAMSAFPDAFDSISRAEVRHLWQVLGNLHLQDHVPESPRRTSPEDG